MDTLLLCPLWTDFVTKGKHDIPKQILYLEHVSLGDLPSLGDLALPSHVQWEHPAFVVIIIIVSPLIFGDTVNIYT